MPDSETPMLSQETRESGLIVITLQGELDSSGVTALEPAFQAALPQRTVHAVVDLTGVPYVSSRALALFLTYTQSMRRAGGDLRLAGATEEVAKVFQQAGFSDLMVQAETVDEAIEHIEKKLKK